jgi:hypothetical protein
VNAQDPKAEIFDVFLCHNSEDKPAVVEIAQRLKEEGIKPWLDVEQIRPGTTWQTALGEQIESIKSVAVFVGKNGIGPWQNEEIQAFLSEFMRRGCPAIPTVLMDAIKTPELPWTLRNRHWVDFRAPEPDPLRQLIWGITGVKAIAPEPVIPREDNTTPRTKFSESRYYPPLAQAPDQEQAIQLNILRQRVMEYWVDGVLEHSVYNEVLISLGKREVSNAIDAPWKYTVEVSQAMNSGSLDDRDVRAIYDTSGLLLILGEPGSGKTTTLLDLARILLERAEDDIRERVPIVVNLSSWKKKQPLVEWISIELSEKYRVPRKIGRFWLQRGYLLPLLDGLDEVEMAIQPDCVATINAFIEEFEPSGLVVCCRLNEYRWLPKRLKLNGAIYIEPLSSEEVGKYLDAAGSELAAFREAIDTDSVLQELAQTPLMLSIMSLAFQEVGREALAAQKGDLPEQRRKKIFRLYVDQMFQRKAKSSLGFPNDKIIGWLSWLAGKMKEHSQSVFLVEELQPSWLGTKAKQVAYGSIVALSLGLVFGLIFGLNFGLNFRQIVWLNFHLIMRVQILEPISNLLFGLIGTLFSADIEAVGGPNFGLIFGLIICVGVGLGCWSKSPVKNGVISGSISGIVFGMILGMIVEGPIKKVNRLAGGPISGLLYGLVGSLIFGIIGGLGVGSLSRVILVETISWKWNQFWRNAVRGSILGLIFGLILGPILMLDNRLSLLIDGVIDGIVFGLTFGLICGLVSGLVGGFSDRVKVGKASPNQGIKLSWKNSFAAFLVSWITSGVIFGLISGLIFGLSYELKVGLTSGLKVGLTSGLMFGLIVGLNRGGSAVIKHYALRLILWLSGNTPLNFIKFLDHCAKLIFLKKVGGGYIFIHRMLLDYFADLPQSTKVVDRKTGSVGD